MELRGYRCLPRYPGATFGAAIAFALGCAINGSASAHSFGQIYNLPVPVSMYLYGAAAALVASFLVVGYFVGTAGAAANFRTRSVEGLTPTRWPMLRSVARGMSVGGLLLCIVSGLVGSNNAYQNLNMTLFWVLFILGFTYLTALIGDLYEVINPWRVLVEWIERFRRDAFAGHWPYPERLACWPALALYMGFIWIELFGHTKPFSLSVALLIYTCLNFAGAWCLGKGEWFRHCEFLGVFLRQIARMSPFVWTADADGHLRLVLRQPFIGLLDEQPRDMSVVVFILFMLSSTAFDGIKETVWWVRLFWKDIYDTLEPLVGIDVSANYALWQKLYLIYQTACLAASPFLYLAIVLVCLAVMKRITRSALSLGELAMRFAFTLIPIAFVYNVTHYYTLIVTQGTQIVRLVSDPFGFGWDLLRTKQFLVAQIIPDVGVVWHTQVWLIVAGHVVSVYLAHLEALRLFPSGRQASFSQLPMLALMVGFTTVGLWILSLPLQAGVRVG